LRKIHFLLMRSAGDHVFFVDLQKARIDDFLVLCLC